MILPKVKVSICALFVLVTLFGVVSYAWAEETKQSSGVKWKQLSWKLRGGPCGERGGYLWGLEEMWWYGLARGFGIDADVDVQCRNCHEFVLQGQARRDDTDAYFGIEMQWNLSLQAKTAYHFSLGFWGRGKLPELITIDDEVVWRYSDKFAKKDQMHLYYISGEEPTRPVMRLFYRAGKEPKSLKLNSSMSPHAPRCYEASYEGPRPDYEQFRMPEGKNVKYVAADPTYRGKLCDEYLEPVEYQRPPLPKLDRAVADLTVIQRNISASGAKYLPAADVQTFTFQPRPRGNETNFSRWCDAAIENGVKNLVMTPVVETRRVKKYKGCRPDLLAGYCFSHLHGKLEEDLCEETLREVEAKGQKCTDLVADTEAALINEWLERMPSSQVYHFDVEMNGAIFCYQPGLRDWYRWSPFRYEGIENMTRPEAYATIFKFFKNYHDRIRSQLGEKASQMKVIANFDRVAFQGAYAAKADVDVVIHKCIHRQSINIAVANSRGIARAYGVDYGYDFDAWDRNYWWGYPPASVRHGLMVMYHTGAPYIMNEIDIFNEEAGKLNHWGVMWFDFLRYAKLHPPRGEGKARIAVMRGFGDEWNRVGGPSAGWDSGIWFPVSEVQRALRSETVPSKWSKMASRPDRPKGLGGRLVRKWMAENQDAVYMHDFGLLDLLFANFGTEHQTDMNHLCAGTPFGPVDFIPWDTPASVLNTYDTILYFGRGDGTTLEEIKALEAFVAQGGNLVLAAGHLRGFDDQIAIKKFCGIELQGDRHTDAGLIYTKLQAPKAGSVVQRFENGDPKLVSAPFGKGHCRLFSGEWLTYWDDEAPKTACREALATALWLRFEPGSEWLEYQVRQKNDCWILPVFNHGRGFYPSGNGHDHGVWQGRVVVDLEKFELANQPIEAWRVVYNPETRPDPFTLEPVLVTTSADGRHATIELTLDEFEELVLGPKGKARAGFFQP